MSPVVNISECTPYSPPPRSASRPTTIEGIPPMPVWRVAPSGISGRTCSAMAVSAALGSTSGSTKGSRSDSTSTSISSRWMRWGYAGSSPEVRGNLSLASTISTRSGSAPAVWIASTVAPAWSESERKPSAVRRRRDRRDDAGCELLGDAGEPAEVRRDELDASAAVHEETLRGPEEAREVPDPGVQEHLVEIHEQRAEDGQVDPVVPGAERVEEGRRLSGPERDPQRVAGPSRPAASEAVARVGAITAR